MKAISGFQTTAILGKHHSSFHSQLVQRVRLLWHAFVCRTEHLLLPINKNNQGRYLKHKNDFIKFVPFQNKGKLSHKSSNMT